MTFRSSFSPYTVGSRDATQVIVLIPAKPSHQPYPVCFVLLFFNMGSGVELSSLDLQVHPAS